MKKLVIISGAILCFLVLASLIAPFVVDLNKFRPAIKKIVENNINGTFEVEDIKLTVLSGFGAEISGLSVNNLELFDGANLFKTERIRLRASIFSIFRGVSNVDFVVDSPEIKLIKNQDGKLNIIDILGDLITEGDLPPDEEIKVSNLDEKKDAPKEDDALKEDQGEVSILEAKILELLKKIVVNVEVKNSAISFRDLKENTKKEIHNFYLSLNDVRLGEKFNYKFSNVLKLSEFGVEGPLVGSGEFFIDFSNGPDVLTEGEINLDKLKVRIPEMLEKRDSDKSTLKYHFSLKDLRVRITKDFNFEISNLMDRVFNDTMNLRFRLNSNLSSSYMPRFTDFSVNFDSKGSNLSVRAKVSELDNFDISINSKFFRLDDFIPPPPPLLTSFATSGKAKEPKNVELEEEPGKDDSGQSMSPFEGIKTDPYFLGLRVNGEIRFDRIIAARTEITNFIGNFGLTNLRVLSSCTFNIFRGNINLGQLVFNMRTAKPAFHIDARVLGINLGVVSNDIIGLKDALDGRINGNLKFSGSGINPEEIKKTIRGEAKLDGSNVKIEVFNVLETLKNEIESLAFLSNLNFSNYSFKDGYDIFNLDLAVSNQTINISRFDLIKHKHHVVALKGKSTFEPDLDLQGDVILLPPFSQTVVPLKAARTILFNRNNEALIPFFVAGGVQSGVRYGIDKERLENLYARKTKDVVVEKAKDKAIDVIKESKITEKVIDKVPEKHQDKAKKMLKKFGF